MCRGVVASGRAAEPDARAGLLPEVRTSSGYVGSVCGDGVASGRAAEPDARAGLLPEVRKSRRYVGSVCRGVVASGRAAGCDAMPEDAKTARAAASRGKNARIVG